MLSRLGCGSGNVRNNLGVEACNRSFFLKVNRKAMAIWNMLPEKGDAN